MDRSFLLTLLYFVSIFVYFIDELKFFKFGSVVILLIFVIYQNVFFNNKFRILNIFIIVFVSMVIISGLISEIELGKYQWHISFFSSLLLACQTIACFGYTEYVLMTGQSKRFLSDLTIILGLCLLISDIYIYSILPSIVEEPIACYFIGNKFIISYYHILFFALCGTIFELSKVIAFLLFIYCLLISKIVYCSTGIIGALAFYILYIGRKYFKLILYNPFFFFLAIILSSCFAIFVTFVIALPMFQSMLEFLGESPSLTGRTGIYAHIIDIIAERPLLGLGNANNTSYVQYYTGIGNAQNGLIADIIDWGLIGVTFFLIMVISVISSCKNRERSYCLLCFLYMYIVTGMVEITMGGKFIVALSVFLVASHYRHSSIRYLKLLLLFKHYLPNMYQRGRLSNT